MYLFAPLDRHYDKGFGAVADSFHDAASALKEQYNRAMLNGHLPLCYLFRHSIELFLKGAIIIVHQGLKIPYGAEPCTSEPKLPFGNKLKSMYAIHDINLLYRYLSDLLIGNKAGLCKVTNTNWQFADDLDSKIDRLKDIDSSSTYFRYPIDKYPTFEREKSAFKRASVEEVMTLAKKNNEPMKSMKVMALIDQDTQVFVHDDSFTEEVIVLLADVAEEVSNFHFALMRELGSDGLS